MGSFGNDANPKPLTHVSAQNPAEPESEPSKTDKINADTDGNERAPNSVAHDFPSKIPVEMAALTVKWDDFDTGTQPLPSAHELQMAPSVQANHEETLAADEDATLQAKEVASQNHTSQMRCFFTCRVSRGMQQAGAEGVNPRIELVSS